MREEVISTGGTANATPTASSADVSTPAVPTSTLNLDCSSCGYVSKIVSLSRVVSQQPQSSLSPNACESARGSSQPSCRPWEREDLLRRLSTFRPSNWFGKPKVASSLSCALRGWVNVDVDKILCECCGARLSFVLPPSWAHAQVEHAGLAFASQLDAVHSLTCPWKGDSCPESLVQFLPTHQSALIGGYKDRHDGLLQFRSLPIVASSAIEHMSISHGAQLERFLSQPQEVYQRTKTEIELENSRDDAFCLYSRAQMLISLCGWEPRWLPNVQDCEEHSAQSARNGGSFGPTHTHGHMLQDLGPSKIGFPSMSKIGARRNKAAAVESRCESRSPLLDCGLCGATVRMWDFLTVPQPAFLAPPNLDIPDTNRKIALTRGASAASGINGWADDAEEQQTEDHDEVATTSKGTTVPNSNVDLNLSMVGVSSYIQMGRPESLGNSRDLCVGRDLMIRQPSGSEVGDCAVSHESRGPSRKRTFEKDGSSDYRTDLKLRQADSMEATVIDRDNDEVTDEKQFSAGPSKRNRDWDMFDTYCSPYPKESSGAGPSHSKGLEIYADGNRVSSQTVRDSARASSVVAMDTVFDGPDDDSFDSVENYQGDVDDIDLPSSSIYANPDMNETSELNYSNQVQQSVATELARGEMGVSSTNDGEAIFNGDIPTPRQPRDGGISLGISGGSVGMCASHEAEIHGADASVHRGGSFIGDAEPKVEDVENQCQTGESAPGPGLMDGIVLQESIRVDSHGDSQEMSQSTLKADSGSKVDGSTKAESLESGEKIGQSHKLALGNNDHLSVSCNAVVYSGYATSKEVTGAEKASSPLKDSDFVATNGIGPPKGESNYEGAKEFDPIAHHNMFCPWVNGNVAAAGYLSCGLDASADVVAHCGWQLTLDALDTSKSLENHPSHLLPSESAASLSKDDQQIGGRKFLRHHSFSRP